MERGAHSKEQEPPPDPRLSRAPWGKPLVPGAPEGASPSRRTAGPKRKGESGPKAHRQTAVTLTRLPGLCSTWPAPCRGQRHEAAGARQGRPAHVETRTGTPGELVSRCLEHPCSIAYSVLHYPDRPEGAIPSVQSTRDASLATETDRGSNPRKGRTRCQERHAHPADHCGVRMTRARGHERPCGVRGTTDQANHTANCVAAAAEPQREGRFARTNEPCVPKDTAQHSSPGDPEDPCPPREGTTRGSTGLDEVGLGVPHSHGSGRGHPKPVRLRTTSRRMSVNPSLCSTASLRPGPDEPAP